MPLSTELLEGIQNDWHYRFDDLAALKANMHDVDENGQTLLHHAVLHNRTFWIMAFIYAGMNLNIRNRNNHTPLDLALRLENNDNIELLKRYAAQCTDQKKLQEYETLVDSKIEQEIQQDSTSMLKMKLFFLNINISQLEEFRENAFLKDRIGSKQTWYNADAEYGHCLRAIKIFNAIEKELIKRNEPAAALTSSDANMAETSHKHHPIQERKEAKERKNKTQEEILREQKLHRELCESIRKDFDNEQDSLGIFYNHMYCVEKHLVKGNNYTREGSMTYKRLRNRCEELGKKYEQFQKYPEKLDFSALHQLREELISLFKSIMENVGSGFSYKTLSMQYKRMKQNEAIEALRRDLILLSPETSLSQLPQKDAATGELASFDFRTHYKNILTQCDNLQLQGFGPKVAPLRDEATFYYCCWDQGEMLTAAEKAEGGHTTKERIGLLKNLYRTTSVESLKLKIMSQLSLMFFHMGMLTASEDTKKAKEYYLLSYTCAIHGLPDESTRKQASHALLFWMDKGFCERTHTDLELELAKTDAEKFQTFKQGYIAQCEALGLNPLTHLALESLAISAKPGTIKPVEGSAPARAGEGGSDIGLDNLRALDDDTALEADANLSPAPAVNDHAAAAARAQRTRFQ